MYVAQACIGGGAVAYITQNNLERDLTPFERCEQLAQNVSKVGKKEIEEDSEEGSKNRDKQGKEKAK